MPKIKIKSYHPQLCVQVHAHWYEELDEEQCGLMKSNYAPGLMRLKSFDGSNVEFLAPADRKICDMLHSGINSDTFFKLIKQLAGVLRWLSEQRLPISGLELNADHIFVNSKTQEMFMLYVPVRGYEQNASLKSFLECLVFESSFALGEDTSFKQELMNLINSGTSISTKRLEQYVHTFSPDTEKSVSKPVKADKRRISDSKTGYMKQWMAALKENENAALEKGSGIDLFYRQGGARTQNGTTILRENGTMLLEEDGTMILDEDEGTLVLDVGDKTILLNINDGTAILNEDNRTMVLNEEDGTMFLDEDEGWALLKIGDKTVLLNANDGTVFLNENRYESALPYPVLIRRSTGEEISVNKPVFRIGTEEGSTDYLVVGNSTVSRNHAVIKSRDGSYYFSDNNSTNRSYINNIIVEPLKDIELFDGTRVRLSNEEFEFRIMDY